MRAVRRRGGAAEGPRRLGPRRVVGAKISQIFPSLATIFSLSSLSWRSFCGIGGVIESRDPQMCTFGVHGLSCEAPAAPKLPGLHTTPVHISGSRPSETQKSEMKGGRGGVRVRGSTEILDEPHENLEHTHDTPWPQKQDMSNKFSRRAAPLAKVVKDDSHSFGHKTVLKVVRAKCC